MSGCPIPTPESPLRILDSITDPARVPALGPEELEALAAELRARIIDSVSRTGGHLASSLGVVELTLALLRVFNPARDKIVWDVGHQAYGYKMLTGRAGRFDTLRQFGGISGFPKRSESPYDHFGVGHASTSISAALGMVMARERTGQDYNVVSVVGDGAVTGGMIYEAMNHAGAMAKPFVVVFNDNQMSISKNVGALSYFLSRKLSSNWVRRVKREVSAFLKSIPGVGDDMFTLARRSKQSFKTFFTPGILFEALRFNYIGPVNGHDIEALEQALSIAAAEDKPTLVHVLTQKGKGYLPAENDPTNFHGIGRFNPNTGDVESPGKGDNAKSFTQIFSSALCQLAQDDQSIVAITAAMPDGTGLAEFARRFPERFYDVGICEQHAVTFAAGLATQGVKPVVALYSTFLQRGYDQVLHDVCLQDLPVVFALDRSGLVGEDGPTHHGVFDIAYLRHIPNLSILSPRGRCTLKAALSLGLDLNAPVVIRYPRGECPYFEQDDLSVEILPGKGELLRPGAQDRRLAVLALGALAHPACLAAEALAAEGFSPAVYDPIWVKPLAEEEILRLAEEYDGLLVLEEHVLQGGFGSAVLELLNERGMLGRCRVFLHGLPDEFVEHGQVAQLRQKYRLDERGLGEVMREALDALKRPAE
ncbi:1-deoxy-D-xylulose-5-phosphate synthase [Desulfovibrio sp. OttesenSCG-928-C14]|nr:1-deoxy-D-xylulose-5-phosphate synthase [Desulfovibrio sp. OttesenSCG-928-C14]